MKPKPLNVAIVLFMAATWPLAAQVTVNGTGSFQGAPVGTTFTYTYNLATPLTTNVIVVGMYNDNGNAITGMTFGGVAATRFSAQTRSAVGSYIFPGTAPTTITIVGTVAAGAAPNAGFYIYELGGVDTSGGAAAIDAGTGSSITTTGADKFVVNFKAHNAGGSTMVPSGSIIPGANAGVFNAGGGGGGSLGHGYGVSGPSAGVKTLGWSVAGDGEVSLAFVQSGDLDVDDDGLTDTWEIAWELITDLTQLNGLITTPSGSGNGSGDWDGDGHTDIAEFNGGVNSSDPTNPASVPGDIDGDSFDDATEIANFGNLSQTPGGDYDGDSATNSAEVTAGTPPTNAAIWPDTDTDLMSDAWETAHGLIVGTDDSAGHADADGFTNLEEFHAGTDPQDTAWAPGNAKLAHRWSFTGDLTDSVGGSNAQIVNDDMLSVGSSSALNATTLGLLGGPKGTSDYVNLGSNLLSGLQVSGGVKPVTIELWATQEIIQSWSRIFDFGVNSGVNPITNESLRMTWTQGTDLNADQISWEPTASFAPGNAPYVPGIPYHIVMTIEPAAFTGGAIASGARVTWYSAPAGDSQAGGHPLYGAKGSFNTTAGTDLRALIDSACTLGRSMYGDNTASATYDEVRIWKGVLSETERTLFQLLGPDDMNRADSEPDGFPDAWEMARFGNLATAAVGVDSDGDGEDDDAEFAAESNPNALLSTSANVDQDSLADSWERLYFKNLLQLGTDDPDNDLADNESEEVYGTNPANANSSPDTDGDGISDGWEFTWFPDLATADSTLRPGGTNTNSDGDFDNDLEEFQSGFDPVNKFSGRDTENADTGDGLPDYWEFFYFQPLVGANYLNIVVPSQDYEPDGATNAEELADGTNPADGNDFSDSNNDGFYDGIVLAATDGFGTTSFNAGTNWPGALAPVAGKSYLVNGGRVLRTPNVANQISTFAGARLALAESQFLLKGGNSTAQANYVFDGVTVRNGEDAGQPVTLAGTVLVVDPSNLLAENGTIVVSAKVSGSGDLTATGNATVIRQVHFNNATNDWTGDLIVGPTASLVVNGTLNPGTSSIYNIRPGAAGVTNSIGGAGTFTLAGTLNLDLSAVALSPGATWNLVTIVPTYDAGFTVADSAALVGGFTPDAGAVGSRIWTSGDGNYAFDEASGILSFIGTLSGYAEWSGTSGLTTGLNDGAEDNPDTDGYGNILEYQLGGDPLVFDGDLVTATQNATHLIFTFERSDASETDSTLNFRWGTSLAAWNTVPLIPGTNGNGVVVTVTEDGGASADYDLIQVQLPKSNASGGKLFGQLQGTAP